MVEHWLDAADAEKVVDAARRAAGRFPWYADKLSSAGFWDSPDLAHLPFLHEDDLESTYYADTAAADDGTGTTYLTSGTATGARKGVSWPSHDDERYLDHRAAVFSRFLGDSCRTACADLGTGHAAGSALELFARLGLPGTEIDITWPLERHIETLSDTKPDLLYTMPMILERIVAAGGPGYVPRRVVVVGDLAPTEWRAAIARRLGMPAENIMDVFGSIELGAIAYSDDDVSGYLFHEHIVPELDGDRLLALTSLQRDGFPAVRYVSGDVVAGLRRYSVRGTQRWGYQRHLGREGGERKHGEMLSVHSIGLALAEVAPGVTWDVRRSGLEVVIEIEEASFAPPLADTIKAAVRAANPDVDQMISSGLIGDIRVEPRAFEQVMTKRGARRA